jgi:hypothetical protein
VDLRDNLRQHVALLPDQRGGDPAQRRASARPNLRGVPLQRSGTFSSPAVLILPPVSTMKGTKLLWSLYFAGMRCSAVDRAFTLIHVVVVAAVVVVVVVMGVMVVVVVAVVVVFAMVAVVVLVALELVLVLVLVLVLLGRMQTRMMPIRLLAKIGPSLMPCVRACSLGAF